MPYPPAATAVERRGWRSPPCPAQTSVGRCRDPRRRGRADGSPPGLAARCPPPSVACVLACVALAAGAVTTALVRGRPAPSVGPAIQTIAGTGAQSSSADGASALSTSLDHPVAVAIDPSGAVLFIDGNRVRRVTKQRTIVTIAGTGTAGYAGDGGLATSARLDSPRALAVRNDGSIFIADTMNHRIRRVDLGGIITTVAGTGEPGSQVTTARPLLPVSVRRPASRSDSAAAC